MIKFPPKTLITISLACALSSISLADESGSTIMGKEEFDATLKQGLANLAEGRTVSDIVMRHIGVGDENMGVSVVQRSKVEDSGVETGIAHVNLDEIYYIVDGNGTLEILVADQSGSLEVDGTVQSGIVGLHAMNGLYTIER